MKKQIMKEQNVKKQTGHITEQWLNDLTTDPEILKHLGNCDYCAERFADFLEKDLIEPPAYLQEEILERSRGLDIQTARTVHVASKHMRLFLYSMKVGLAVAASLFLLYISPKLEGVGTALLESEPISVTEDFNKENGRIDTIIQNFTGWLHFIDYKEEPYD